MVTNAVVHPAVQSKTLSQFGVQLCSNNAASTYTPLAVALASALASELGCSL